MMLLFVRWCDNEWISKLGAKYDKWAVLIRSAGSKKAPKPVSISPTPTANPLQNFVSLAPESYGFIEVWAISANNIWLNV